MSLGLAKILNKISSEPANKTLIERYVALVKEVQRPLEKVQHFLGLAKILATSNPQLGFQYAFRVYEVDSTSSEALQVMSACLKSLGKFGKAEFLSNETEKLKSAPATAPSLSEKVIKLLKQETAALEATPFSKQDVLSLQQAVSGFKSETTLAQPKDKPNPELMPVAQSLFQQARTALARPSKTVPPPQPKPKLPVPAGQLDESRLKEPAFVIEMFDFYWRAAMYKEVEDLLAKTKAAFGREGWWQARAQAVIKNQERSQPKPAPSNQNSEAAKIWGAELDKYLTEGRIRKAYNRILNMLLSEKNDDALANEAWQRLPKIWSLLGLRGFEWSQAQGSTVLQQRLSQRLPYKMSALHFIRK